MLGLKVIPAYGETICPATSLTYWTNTTATKGAGGTQYNYEFEDVPFVYGLYTLYAYGTDAQTINSAVYSNRVYVRFGLLENYWMYRQNLGHIYFPQASECPNEPVYWDPFDIRSHPEVGGFIMQDHVTTVLDSFMGGRTEWESRTGKYRAHIEVPSDINAAGDYPGWYTLDGRIRLQGPHKPTLNHEYGHHAQRVVATERPCYDPGQCHASVEGFARAYEMAPYGANAFELGYPGGGPTNTMSVAGALGDLVDPANEPFDTISLRFDLLWEIIRADEPECAQVVPHHWRDRGFPNPDDVDAIYAVQGISPAETCP